MLKDLRNLRKFVSGLSEEEITFLLYQRDLQNNKRLQNNNLNFQNKFIINNTPLTHLKKTVN